MYMYMYVYIYIYTYIYTYPPRSCLGPVLAPSPGGLRIVGKRSEGPETTATDSLYGGLTTISPTIISKMRSRSFLKYDEFIAKSPYE